MTDSGSAFVSHAFRHLCASRAIRHIRTRPYTPRTNGKVERLIQTLLRDPVCQREVRHLADGN